MEYKIRACGTPQALISPIHGLSPIGSHCVPMGLISSDVLFILVEISGIEPLTS